MQTVMQLLITSIQIGAIYVLFSLGLTLIFGVMRIVNFAHGHLFAVSALVVAALMPWLADGRMDVLSAYLVSSGVGTVTSILLGTLIYFFGFRFFQRDMVGSFILSIGLVLLLDGILARTFGGAVRAVPPVFPGHISILGVPVAMQRLALCIAAIAITGALYWTMTQTKLGKALRAVSIDHEAAMLQGIRYNRMAFAGFLVATILAALAGALIAPITIVSPIIGADYLIKGFIAVIIGGLGSVPGAILGGLFVAVVETLGTFYFDASWATIAIFTLVIVLLLVRPRGILGHG